MLDGGFAQGGVAGPGPEKVTVIVWLGPLQVALFTPPQFGLLISGRTT
jgi:hypothetical protein